MCYSSHSSSFPRAILHIDGDAFFASCEQSLNPQLKGKPVITGKERGIAASMSYEAKARGVTRGMRLFEIKRLLPDAVILPSDYETYSLLSKRFYDIVRRYTPEVEEYGIDECFADITGMRRPFHMSYPAIAQKLQNDLTRELGFTFSIGLAPNKVVAKIGSKWKKPFGLTVIPQSHLRRYLENLDVEKIWGIGHQTTAVLNKFGVHTALQFADKPESWVMKLFTKPTHEIWQELNGESVMPLVLEDREFVYSAQKFKTFTPPSRDKAFISSQFSRNIENVCIKLRRHRQAAKEVIFCLRTQDFHHASMGAVLSRPTNFAHEIVKVMEDVLDEIYNPQLLYRQTGVIVCNLIEDVQNQLDLFGESIKAEKFSRLYGSVDELMQRFGKHTVYLGSSYQANVFGQHLGERGDAPQRKADLFNGESKRKRLSLPMFTGTVN